MRATGLSELSNKYVFPDGQVEVRISGEHEYIRLTGGSCSMSMDSGVVDLGVATGQLSYLSGNLYESQRVKTYNLPFLPTSPVSSWRRREDKSGPGQVSGTVSVTKSGAFSGKVPYSGAIAESFAAKFIPDTSSVPPGPDIRDPQNETLIAKKNAIRYCPPSVFTGRCRLWVQAMFGRPLFTGAGDANPFPYLNWQIGSSSTPSLKVKAFKKAADTATYEDIDITTNTGVWLDKVTGKHWFLAVAYGYIDIMPLVSSSSCAESMRKFIATESGDSNGTLLNVEDRDHLEAFILATSRPESKEVVRVTLNLDVATYSMGYGWHWNWDGTCADIVVNSGFSQSDTGINPPTAMRSTHYRVTPTYAGGIWSALVSVMEGPTDWTLDRTHWVVLEPNWAGGGSTKVNKKYTDLFDCDAPFYAFYRKNDLKICRANVLGVAEGVTRTALPDYFTGGAPFTSVDAYTIGLLGGSCQDWYSSNYHKAKITVGEYVTPDLYKSHSRSGHFTEASEKTRVGNTWSSGSTYGWGPSWTCESGYPPYVVEYKSGFRYGNQNATLEWIFRDGDNTASFGSVSALVVPKFDAEAVILKVLSYHETSFSGERYQTNTNNLSSIFFMERNQIVRTLVQDGVNENLEYIKYGGNYAWPIGDGSGGPGSYLTSTAFVNEYSGVIVDYDKTLLFGKGGFVETSFGSLDQILNNSIETIDTTYSIQSGASDENPVLWFPNYVDGNFIGGADTPQTASPAIVGWA